MIIHTHQYTHKHIYRHIPYICIHSIFVDSIYKPLLSHINTRYISHICIIFITYLNMSKFQFTHEKV